MCVAFGKKRVKQWQAGPALGTGAVSGLPAANPGPTVPVESHFPFAEPMGTWRGQAEDRLQPAPASARGGCSADVEHPFPTPEWEVGG